MPKQQSPGAVRATPRTGRRPGRLKALQASAGRYQAEGLATVSAGLPMRIGLNARAAWSPKKEADVTAPPPP